MGYSEFPPMIGCRKFSKWYSPPFRRAIYESHRRVTSGTGTGYYRRRVKNTRKRKDEARGCPVGVSGRRGVTFVHPRGLFSPSVVVGLKTLSTDIARR
jgi:hypothetical protein